MTIGTCRDCVFWEPRGVIATAEYGYCNRYPPVLCDFILATEFARQARENGITETRAADGDDDLESARSILPWRFPVTTLDDWCGEWKENE